MADDDDDLGLRVRVAPMRPELDPILVAVIRASAARALFGTAKPVEIGRYQLLREVGTGGGGSVFVARDPELDREIAIKLIVASSAALRDRALAEGKALGKLSHPNVVPVYDVGVVDERIYLVMELVRGESLRAYARTASPRDIVRAYRQAGEGLAAAHAAGLVHRDFKPDNAVIGSDGRVRVIDFGLAVARDVAADGSGTPKYMAPELAGGGKATPASDQFAFGASLGEALAPAVPGWIDPIVRRATAADPAARFPSMDELLRALANDPRTRWKRRALVGVPVALAAGGIAIGALAWGGGGELPPCDGAAALAPAWTAERSAAAEAHVSALPSAFAPKAAPQIRASVDDYAKRWIAGSDAACKDARRDPTAALLERRAACLARARTRLGAAIDLLAAAGTDDVPSIMSAISELPDIARCADPEALASKIDPPTAAQAPLVAALSSELDRIQVAIDAARPDASTLAADAVARARQIAYPPLVATALLADGRAVLNAAGKYAEAIAPLVEATSTAIIVGDDATAVESFARVAWLRHFTGGKAEQALAGLDLATAISRRLGPRDLFARALLLNNVAVVEIADDNTTSARGHLLEALEIARDVTGPGQIELASIARNLARITADPDERRRYLDLSTSTVTARLGDDHPIVLESRITTAYAEDDLVRARDALRPPCTTMARLHPGHHASIVECGSELAWLDLASGATSDARTSLAMVIASAGPDASPDRVEIALAYRKMLDGDPVGAAVMFETIAARNQPATDSAWWEYLFAAEIEIGRALASKDPRVALARAVGLLERAAAVQSQPTITRRLSWARARLTDSE
jgi:hypothetical protein